MRNNPTVNPEMAERVREAAAALGYRPSVSAKSLASGKTETVGVLTPNLANPYFGDVIKAITLEASDQAYRIVISDSLEDPDREVDIAHSLQRDCDGVILLSPRMKTSSLRELSRNGRPLVVVNRVEPGIGIPSIAVDNYTAMMALMAHLLKLGHQRIVYLAGPPRAWQEQERLRAVRQSTAFGGHIDIVEAGGTSDAGYHAIPDALSFQPTAIACFNDLVAFGALARLSEEGLTVPGDISLTGFDDISFAKYADPALTTASSPQAELGSLAWRLMSQVLDEGEAPSPKPLEAPVVIRASTAPPRT